MKLSEKQFGNWDIAVRRNLFMPVNRSVSDVVQKRKKLERPYIWIQSK